MDFFTITLLSSMLGCIELALSVDLILIVLREVLFWFYAFIFLYFLLFGTVYKLAFAFSFKFNKTFFKILWLSLWYHQQS